MSHLTVDFLACAYSKSVDYVKSCLKFYGLSIESLPAIRVAGDGLDDFYSDMTALVFDPKKEGPLDADGKPTYPERSMTKQEFTAECDINTIMKRFVASDFDPTSLPISGRKPMYGDFSEAPESYHAAISYIKETERMFLTLSPDIRFRFDNDPQKFLSFVEDPANFDELVSMGLVTHPSIISTPAVSSRAEGGGDDGSKPKASKSSSKASNNASVADGSESV